MSTVPATSSTTAATAARDMVVASRGRDSGGFGVVRRQGDLQSLLGRPQHPLSHEDERGEDGQTAQHPAIPERIGALAHGDEGESEDRDAVDGASGPVHPGPEVAPQGLGQRQRRPEQPAEPGGRGGGRRRRHQPHHHTGDMEQEHDVEGRPVRLVMHGRHVLLCP